MSVETYIPSSVEFDGRPVEAPVQVTLYHPDGPTPSGSLTSTDAPRAGQTGRLAFQSGRDGKVWSEVCASVTVSGSVCWTVYSSGAMPVAARAPKSIA